VAEDTGAEVAGSIRNGLARAESDGFKCATVFAHGYFGFGAAVDVVEHNLRQAAMGEGAEVFDVDGAGDFGHAADFRETVVALRAKYLAINCLS
jgi:hypothetical protein